MSKIEARIEELGITLPEASAPVGNYVGAKVVGNMVYLSGNGPLGNADSAFKGKVGSDFSLKEGYAAARSTMINLLGTLKGAIGDLDRVETIVKLLGFVASAHVPQTHLLLETDIEIFVTLLLTMFSSSCVGLLISALFSSGESAILAVLVLMIGQVVFSNVMFTLTGAAATISTVIVCRWGMGALGAATDLNSRMAWLQAGLDGPMYDATVENLTHSWQMLGLISLVSLVAAWLVLQIAFDKKKA